jgi:ferric-dicitrate binding protein FerR (iron transport regulator)
MGRIDRRGVTSVQRVSDVRPYIAWTEGRLSYVNAPLPDVLADLSRWYEVEFSIGDHSLEARHLTTSFEKESLAQVVAILEASLEARAVRTGSTVTLRSRGSSPRQ